MTKFSAFMHDKLQLFTADVVGKARELKGAGYSVMTRSGYTSAGLVNSLPFPRLSLFFLLRSFSHFL